MTEDRLGDEYGRDHNGYLLGTADPAGETDVIEAVYDWLDCDEGIRFAVRVLDAAGIETYESCQGGDGHCRPTPFVRFHGGPHEGFRAFTQAMNYGLPVDHLNRFWYLDAGELVGPKWELTFRQSMEDRAAERPIFVTRMEAVG